QRAGTARRVGEQACRKRPDKGRVVCRRKSLAIDKVEYAVLPDAGAQDLVLYENHVRSAPSRIALIDQRNVTNARIGVPEVQVELQVRGGRPEEFTFNAPELGTDVLVDRSVLHDRRNLQAIVVVVPTREICLQSGIHQNILGADFVGIDAFGIIGRRNTQSWLNARIETTRLVPAGIRSVDGRLIGEVKLWRPIQNGAAGPLAVCHLVELVEIVRT